MKLSKHTIDVLKNFNSINQGILIKKGSVLQTISMRKNIFATAKIMEVFDREFAIYDLSEFLNILQLFNDPELQFEKTHILVKSTSDNCKKKVKYFYSSPDVIVAPPEKQIQFPDADVSFQMSEDVLDSLHKAAGVMKLKTINVEPGLITLQNDNSNGNQFSHEVNMVTDMNEFNFKISIENLKLIAADYTVEVASKGISKFTNDVLDIEYYIALDAE